MKMYYPLLAKTDLFAGIDPSEYENLLLKTGATKRSFKKGETIFSEGQKPTHLGLVLSGKVQILRHDFYGNQSIIAQFGPLSLFGESFACTNLDTYPVTVIALQDSDILLVESKGILASGHYQMLANLTKAINEKNLMLNDKLTILTQKSSIDRVMTYLNQRAKKAGSASFSIPFNRQQLADFIGIERSSLSTILSKLQKEGKIKVDKNHFTILGQ